MLNKQYLKYIIAGLVLVAVGYFIGANSKPDIKVKTELEIQKEIDQKVAAELEKYKKSLKTVRNFDPNTGKLIKEVIVEKEEKEKQSFTAENKEKESLKFEQTVEIRKNNHLSVLISQPLKLENKQNIDIILCHKLVCGSIGSNTNGTDFRVGIGLGFSF